ncbi:diacylglycerol kinase family protein [Fulvivirgaceae bacterium BMA12]|uniref:Diacylglycerol kinase family protein n=1 Tax=Agaribacillus aureus TaxID=3051825 RepID=A0ABT8L2B3_9BACT|nr:diacylglycerol kinase family protein [Fulvivirgaceae bacterium BMA12]
MARFSINFGKSLQSFKYAFKGLLEVFKNENNFRFHLLATSITVGMGFYFSVTTTEWLFIIVFIGMVTMAEVFNTAMEKMVDWQSPDPNPQAGKIKDVAAAAVLLASGAAFVGGILIFYKYFMCL